MLRLEDRIKSHENKLRELKALQQKLLAQKRATESKKLRTEETRRKVILGALMLEKIRKDDDEKRRVLHELDSWLKRDDDRALFGLSTATTSIQSTHSQP